MGGRILFVERTHLQRHAVFACAGGHEEAQHDVVRVDGARVGHVDVVEHGRGLEVRGDVADDARGGLGGGGGVVHTVQCTGM